MNHLFYKIPKYKTNVVFTRHAKQRLLQRFRLFLTLTERDNPELFLKKDFNKAMINMADFMSAGFMNQLNTKYGYNSFIATSNHLVYHLVYHCVFDEEANRIIVKTILKKD